MRFNARNSKGNYQLDYWQTREAFALSEDLPQRVRRFHRDRFQEVSRDKPHPISKNHRFVLVHLVPLGAFARRMPVSVERKVLLKNLALLAPMMMGEAGGELPPDSHAYFDLRWNIDGPLLFSPITKSLKDGYVQVLLHEGGVIEAVGTVILDPEAHGSVPPLPAIRTRILEDCLLSAVSRWLRAMKEQMEIAPQIMLIIALRGVESFYIRNSDDRRDLTALTIQREPEKYRIDRNEIHIPEIIVNTFEEEPADFLRDAFDALWQSGGWERCLNCDENRNRRK